MSELYIFTVIILHIGECAQYSHGAAGWRSYYIYIGTPGMGFGDLR